MKKQLLIFGMVLGLFFALAACGDSEVNTAEDAVEAVEETTEDAAQEVEEAVEEATEETQDAGQEGNNGTLVQ
jgi:hypothetical protein